MENGKYYICRGVCSCFGTITDENGSKSYENEKMFLEKHVVKNGKEVMCSADYKPLSPDCSTVVLDVPVRLLFDEYSRIAVVEELNE